MTDERWGVIDTMTRNEFLTLEQTEVEAYYAYLYAQSEHSEKELQEEATAAWTEVWRLQRLVTILGGRYD